MSMFLSGLKVLSFEERTMVAVFAIEVLCAFAYLFYLEWKFCRESRQMDTELQAWKTQWDLDHTPQKSEPRLKLYSPETDPGISDRRAA